MLVRSINVTSSMSTVARNTERIERLRQRLGLVAFYIEKVNSKPFYWVPVLNVLNFICDTAHRAHTHTHSPPSTPLAHSQSHSHSQLTDWLTYGKMKRKSRKTDRRSSRSHKSRCRCRCRCRYYYVQCIELFVLHYSDNERKHHNCILFFSPQSVCCNA